MTDLVRQVYEEVKRVKPHVKVTASVVASGECTQDFEGTRAYNMLLQDWERWLEEGIVDAVFPMNYKSERRPEDAKLFRDWTSGMVRWRHDRHVINGMSAYWMEGLVRQIRASRECGTDGVCGFHFNKNARRGHNAFLLRREVFPHPVAVPRMPWKPERPPYAVKSDDTTWWMYYGGVECAMSLISEALAANPKSADLHYRLGRLYRLRGMETEAMTEFRKAQDLDPSHEGAKVELSRL